MSGICTVLIAEDPEKQPLHLKSILESAGYHTYNSKLRK